MQTNTDRQTRRPSGRRSIPEALIHALKIEQTGGPLPKVKKGQLTLALRGARSGLGISRAVTETLCLMIGLIDAKVFEGGLKPIVSASNSFLAYEAGICVRALQARTAAAIASGLLIPVDSPDMKRLTRTHDGEAERYGFDLSPLVRRFEELEAMRAAFLETYKEGQKIKRAISRTRNQCLAIIDAMAEAGADDAMEKVAKVQEIVSQRRKEDTDPATLGPVLIELEAFKTALVDNMAERSAIVENPVSEAVECSSGDEVSFTHQITTKGKPVSKETTEGPCNAAAGSGPAHTVRVQGEREREAVDAKERPITGDFPLTPALACQIAPAFQAYVTNPTWLTLLDAAPYVTESLDIARWSWGRACQTLGRLGALAILIAVAGRHERGAVACPGGLFTRMTELATEGTLNLDRTLYGLIGQMADQMQ